MNLGFTQEEIDKLKRECSEENAPYVLVEDGIELDDTGEYSQFQFVGKKDGKEVIYDVGMMTTRLVHSSLLLTEAEAMVAKKYRDFVPLEDRTEGYKVNIQADELIQEYIEELEEEETVTVAEFMSFDENYDFGIGLEVALHAEEINDKVIRDFIDHFNNDSLKLDNTEKSFKHYDED